MDVLSASEIPVNNGNAYVKMPPFSSMIIVSDDIVNSAAEAEPEVQKIPDTTETEIVIGGKYRHFKGGEYELLSVARHSENNEELVIYKSLKDGQVWARPKAMFVGMAGDVRRFMTDTGIIICFIGEKPF